jgi:Methyltransferase domain
MFIANYGLKSIVQKAAMVARLPIAYSQDHPYTGLKERAHRETLDFITETMPDALAFDTPRELMHHALSLVRVDGLYAEFGVNNGGTITYIAKQKPAQMIHGFDSFEGLPEDWSGNAMAAGFFSRKGQLPKVPRNVVLHPGWFDATAPKFAAEHPGPLAFLHVDCDLYSSTATTFAALSDRIVPGTVIVFDEYFNYPNWKAHEHRAFTEFQGISGITFKHVGYSIQQVAAVAL